MSRLRNLSKLTAEPLQSPPGSICDVTSLVAPSVENSDESDVEESSSLVYVRPLSSRVALSTPIAAVSTTLYANRPSRAPALQVPDLDMRRVQAQLVSLAQSPPPAIAPKAQCICSANASAVTNDEDNDHDHDHDDDDDEKLSAQTRMRLRRSSGNKKRVCLFQGEFLTHVSRRLPCTVYLNIVVVALPMLTLADILVWLHPLLSGMALFSRSNECAHLAVALHCRSLKHLRGLLKEKKLTHDPSTSLLSLCTSIRTISTRSAAETSLLPVSDIASAPLFHPLFSSSLLWSSSFDENVPPDYNALFQWAALHGHFLSALRTATVRASHSRVIGLVTPLSSFHTPPPPPPPPLDVLPLTEAHLSQWFYNNVNVNDPCTSTLRLSLTPTQFIGPSTKSSPSTLHLSIPVNDPHQLLSVLSISMQLNLQPRHIQIINDTRVVLSVESSESYTEWLTQHITMCQTDTQITEHLLNSDTHTGSVDFSQHLTVSRVPDCPSDVPHTLIMALRLNQPATIHTAQQLLATLDRSTVSLVGTALVHTFPPLHITETPTLLLVLHGPHLAPTLMSCLSTTTTSPLNTLHTLARLALLSPSFSFSPSTLPSLVARLRHGPPLHTAHLSISSSSPRLLSTVLQRAPSPPFHLRLTHAHLSPNTQDIILSFSHPSAFCRLSSLITDSLTHLFPSTAFSLSSRYTQQHPNVTYSANTSALLLVSEWALRSESDPSLTRLFTSLGSLSIQSLSMGFPSIVKQLVDSHFTICQSVPEHKKR